MNWRAPLFVLLLTASSAALAHTEGSAGGMAQGFAHPLQGLGHLLAMLVVGVWAARFSGIARWLMPMAFALFMAVGVGLGGRIDIPLVEPMLPLSVLVLGLLVASAVRLPVAIGAAVVALFAVFHGHAHFSDMPDGASLLPYASGMLLATGLLHGVGLLGALQAARLSAWLPRAVGGVVSLLGVALLLGL